VEHFYRLVSRNVCGLGPYNEADARQMIDFLAVQQSIALDEASTKRLLELSGGHAGLLKDILSLLRNVLQESRNTDEPAKLLARIAPTLLEAQVVQDECQKIWASLSEDEQTALPTLLAGQPVDPPTLQRLSRKGLVRQGSSEILLFSPVFADFVRRQRPSAPPEVVISRSPRRVQLEGRRVEGLSGLEFELLHYLYQHRDRVCSKDELIEHVYRQQYDRMAGGVSDMALQQLIARLRSRIEPDRKQPRYIITVRGEGYRFIEPAEP
jgi:DNA-binding response OmpR family regulator